GYSNFSFPSRRSTLRFETLDFGQNGGGFVFERLLHAGVVGVGNLAGLVLKIQIAQVLVYRLFALPQECGTGLLRADTEIQGDIEDVEKDNQGEQTEHRERDRQSSLR